MPDSGWKRPFDDPIPLPRGRQLATLQDAANYIMKLPKAEQNLDEWQTAEGRDFLMHAHRQFNPPLSSSHTVQVSSDNNTGIKPVGL
jgi:hypothetical protein